MHHALSAEARSWLSAQTTELLRVGWRARSATAAITALFCQVFALSDAAQWSGYPGPLLAYALLALGVSKLIRNRIAYVLTPAYLVLDVGLITYLQWQVLPYSRHPAGVAGFTLGLFALLVVVNALAVRAWVTWSTAAVATVGEVWLMRQTDVVFASQLMAGVVLAIVAALCQWLSSRLMGYAAHVSRSEVEREVQQRRFAEVEQARQTIEQMWREADERNRALEALQQEKEVLTQVLVHDLRSPLSVVMLSFDWARQELASMPGGQLKEVREALAQGHSVARRINSMVTDLLNIAKLEQNALPLVPEVVHVPLMMRDVATEFGLMAKERGLSLQVDCGQELALTADKRLLVRLLENLTSNALRYAPRGGRVQLHAEATGQGLRLCVRNDGPAIPVEARGALFDKFQQLGTEHDRRTAGFGLGLYFCRLVAQAHRGSIAVEDEAGWSTSMVVQLPAMLEQRPAMAA